MLALTAVACGQGGSLSPPSVEGLSGYVFAGFGTDGNFSGQPLAGVLVRYESAGEVATVTTDGDGFFSTRRKPAGPFAVHVLPHPGLAAARSVYGDPGTGLGLRLRFYLPLRRPVGSSPRGTGNRPVRAVTGTLVSPQGSVQPGFVRPGRTPGDPGTVGFVWWGAYRFQSATCPRCYSSVTGHDGTFEIQGLMGGQTPGRTLPFFAGNYDGVSSDGLIAHYTAYAFLPAVGALSSRPTDLGAVQLVPSTGVLPIHYDGTTAALAGSYGPGGVVYTFVQMHVAPPADFLELAEAANGPLLAGTVVPVQSVPVPPISEAESRYLFVTSFVLDARARDLPEVAATRAFRVPGQPVRVSHIQPPRILRVQSSNRPSFLWTPSPGATVHAVSVLDALFSEVWTGILGAHDSTAAVPLELQPGVYRVSVFASDALLPSDLVGSGRLPPLVEALRDMRPLPGSGRPVQAIGDVLRPLLQAPAATGGRGQLVPVALTSPRAVREAVGRPVEFRVP
ncbi:MAG: carboxypeptidase-like regulatory domain-containing protein [Armatimonadota bacterium]|nr:carboxypeptidase-like regulatory domain-containing protein [Armatimonadota bacterium]MDR7605556.1 carboxypeptidase-like regulatory domain-containing protein [Armatimonadota bacterium]